MRHQNPQFIRHSLTLILSISVVSVASRCLSDEPPPQAASSAGERLPQVSELMSRSELPDPLVMLDGRRVTTRDQWVNERRPELIRLFHDWINPEGQFEVLRGAAPVYRLLGAEDFTATELPPDGKLIDGTLGYFLRPGGHSLKPEDGKAVLDFADKQLGPPARPRCASAQRTGESRTVARVQSSPHTPCAETGTRSVGC